MKSAVFKGAVFILVLFSGHKHRDYVNSPVLVTKGERERRFETAVVNSL